jgi:hypothetical protein
MDYTVSYRFRGTVGDCILDGSTAMAAIKDTPARAAPLLGADPSEIIPFKVRETATDRVLWHKEL